MVRSIHDHSPVFFILFVFLDSVGSWADQTTNAADASSMFSLKSSTISCVTLLFPVGTHQLIWAQEKFTMSSSQFHQPTCCWK